MPTYERPKKRKRRTSPKLKHQPQTLPAAAFTARVRELEVFQDFNHSRPQLRASFTVSGDLTLSALAVLQDGFNADLSVILAKAKPAKRKGSRKRKHG